MSVHIHIHIYEQLNIIYIILNFNINAHHKATTDVTITSSHCLFSQFYGHT